MERSSRLCCWLLTALGLCAPAIGCRQVVQQYAAPLPRLLPAAPSLDQLIATVNANTAQVQTLSAAQATLSGDDFPSLRASVHLERPRRFRLRAETALTGPELDLGSNDERFWFWVRRNQPPAVVFCRHVDFATSPARRMVPLEPAWLVEALGLPYLDPNLPHQGPYPVAGERIEIRTLIETVDGPQTRVTIIDGGHGAVVQQSVYDARGQLLVTADQSQHRRDPLSGAILPQIVGIRSLPFRLAMRLDMGPVEINRPQAGGERLWAMPSYPDTPLVDLAGPPSAAPPR